MKVVILHQHFNTPSSGGGIRSWYLATALVEKGIDVVVITAHNKPEYRNIKLDGIDVHYLPVPYDNKFGFGARILAFIGFAWRTANLRQAFRGASLCYAISVPLTVGLAALWVKKRLKIPFLFEVGDLWPEAPRQMGIVRNYFFLRGLYGLEKTIYANANSIVALSTAIASAIALKAPGKKIDLIPNMADCDFFNPEKKDPQLEEKFQTLGKFVVSYIGAMGLANGLGYFLECAQRCEKNELPVHFIICGDGALRDQLVAKAREMALANLTFVTLQDRRGVKEILNVSDASFVCYKEVPVLETGSPNKFFDGLAAGKMIIINFGGWIRDEIELHRCGFHADPHRPEDFVEKIKDFVTRPDLLEACQKASRALAERKYSRVILSKKFTDLIESHHHQHPGI